MKDKFSMIMVQDFEMLSDTDTLFGEMNLDIRPGATKVVVDGKGFLSPYGVELCLFTMSEAIKTMIQYGVNKHSMNRGVLYKMAKENIEGTFDAEETNMTVDAGIRPERAIYKFEKSLGGAMTLGGCFFADKNKVAEAIGKPLMIFGEVNHEIILEEEDIILTSDEEDVVDLFIKHGLSHGTNPLDIVFEAKIN